MHDRNDRPRYEYPDSAGYPAGGGFLDEGTSALPREVRAADSSSELHDVSVPSADTDHEVTVRRLDAEHRYIAAIGRREIATIRYRIDAGRLVILSTFVDPDFRGIGIAGEFISDVLDELQASGERVASRCPLVSAVIAADPRYADLVA